MRTRSKISKRKLKKILNSILITLAVFAAIAIGLYIYSLGGYQDVDVAQGEGLEKAIEKPVNELINAEIDSLLAKNRSEFLVGEKDIIDRTLDRMNNQSGYEVLHKTPDKIYWAKINYVLLRNEVVELYFSNRKEYDEIMKSITIHSIKDVEKKVKFYFDQDYFDTTAFGSKNDSIIVSITGVRIVKDSVYKIEYNAYINGRKASLKSYDGIHFDDLSY